MEVLRRTLTLSAFLHISLLGWLFLNQGVFHSKQETFFIDFIAAPSLETGGSPLAVSAKQKAPARTAEKGIHSKEDLLLKSKEKNPPKTLIIPKVIHSSKESKSIETGIPGTAPNSEIGIGLESGSSGGSSISDNFQSSWYIQGMRKKLDSNWSFTAKESTRLTAQVAFTILKNGTVQKTKVEKSSGDETFDLAALRAVESSNPLPPLPTEFPDRELNAHVRFSLKK